MLHVRVIAPAELTDRVVERLDRDEAITHVVVLPSVALSPPGDLIEFDVVREGANGILADLNELGLHQDGAIVLERIDTSISAAADRAARSAPGWGSTRWCGARSSSRPGRSRGCRCPSSRSW